MPCQINPSLVSECSWPSKSKKNNQNLSLNGCTKANPFETIQFVKAARTNLKRFRWLGMPSLKCNSWQSNWAFPCLCKHWINHLVLFNIDLLQFWEQLQLQDLIAAGQQHTYRLQYNYVCFLFNTRKAAVKSFQFQDAGKVTTCYSYPRSPSHASNNNIQHDL